MWPVGVLYAGATRLTRLTRHIISNMCLHMKLCVEPDFSGFADYHGQQGQSPQGASVTLLILMRQPISADSKILKPTRITRVTDSRCMPAEKK